MRSYTLQTCRSVRRDWMHTARTTCTEGTWGSSSTHGEESHTFGSRKGSIGKPSSTKGYKEIRSWLLGTKRLRLWRSTWHSYKRRLEWRFRRERISHGPMRTVSTAVSSSWMKKRANSPKTHLSGRSVYWSRKNCLTNQNKTLRLLTFCLKIMLALSNKLAIDIVPMRGRDECCLFFKIVWVHFVFLPYCFKFIYSYCLFESLQVNLFIILKATSLLVNNKMNIQLLSEIKAFF